MKKLLLLVALFVSTITFASQDEDKLYISYCSNYASGNNPVGYSYSSCVNRNFSSIGRELGGIYLSYCSNYGNTVGYSYISCINRNFTTAAREAGVNYVSYCNNFSTTDLSYSFQSCVNRNMDTIARAINDSNN